MQALNVQRAVAALMPGWDSISDITYLPGGYSNENFSFMHNSARYVLRLPRLLQPYVDRLREQAWYRVLPDDVGIKPLALDVSTGNMITPWVDGKMLIDVWSHFDVADLLGFLQTLHQRLPETSTVYDVAALTTQFWPDGAPVPAASLPVRIATCHNDLNPWNVLVTDHGWLTLDWEFVGRNDPLFDLVALHQGLGLPSQELPVLAAAFLNADVPGTRLVAAQRNFWVRELGWAEFQLRHGNNREEIHEQVAAARRALAALPG